MKKTMALLLVLINLITMISCSVKSETPDIESLEWTLIQCRVTEWGELSEFLGVEEGAGFTVFNDVAEQVFELKVDNGKMYLTNTRNGASMQGSCLKNSKKANGALQLDYEIDLCGNKTFASVGECSQYDWNTEKTGFDGNTYGKYCIDFQFENGTYLSFFAS